MKRRELLLAILATSIGAARPAFAVEPDITVYKNPS